MKIFLASFTYPPNRDGVSESAMSFAEGLAQRGHEVVVGTSEPEMRGAVYDGPPNPVVQRFRIEGGPLHRNGINGEIVRYREFVAQGDFDTLVCLCLDTWPTFLLLPLLTGLGGRKILVSHGFSAHHWYPHRSFPWGLRAWLRGMAFTAQTPRYLSLFDSLVFLSKQRDFRRFFDHTLAAWSHHPSIHVVPNSVDQSFFTATSSERSFREAHEIKGKHIVLCVGNYSSRKNQKLALRAFHESRIPDAAMVFIGSERNEHSQELEKLASALPMPKNSSVHILAGLSRAETTQAFHEATIFVLTAHEETQPIVLLEAMAAGLPFISTPTGCVKEMPGGLTAASLGQIASAMRHLMSDVSARLSLAEAGRAFARAHCMRQQSIKMIESLLTGRPVSC